MGGQNKRNTRPAEAWERRPGGRWLNIRSGTVDSLHAFVRRQVRLKLSVRFSRFDCVEYVVLPVGEDPEDSTEPTGIVAA